MTDFCSKCGQAIPKPHPEASLGPASAMSETEYAAWGADGHPVDWRAWRTKYRADHDVAVSVTGVSTGTVTTLNPHPDK